MWQFIVSMLTKAKEEDEKFQAMKRAQASKILSSGADRHREMMGQVAQRMFGRRQ